MQDSLHTASGDFFSGAVADGFGLFFLFVGDAHLLNSSFADEWYSASPVMEYPDRPFLLLPLQGHCYNGVVFAVGFFSFGVASFFQGHSFPAVQYAT